MNAKAELIEIVYAVEGHREPHSMNVPRDITVKEFAAVIGKKHEVTEIMEVLVEDREDALGDELVLVEVLDEKFKPLHLAPRHSKIKVKVEYGSGAIEKDFRPNATIGRILVWAVGPEGFKLEGKLSDFQLKHNGEVLPNDTHLGQVAHGHKHVTLELVFKIKPQG